MALCKAPPAPDVLLTGSWWSFTGTQLRLMRKSGYNLQQAQRVDFITMCSLIQFFQSIACSLEAFAFFPWITKGETAPPVAGFSSLFASLALVFVMAPLCFTVSSAKSSGTAEWLQVALEIRHPNPHSPLVNGHRGRMWGGDCERRWGAPRNNFSYFILSFQPCAAISERWRYHFQLFKSVNYTAVS